MWIWQLGAVLLSYALAAQAQTARTVAPKVREGCESIGVARMCTTGNVTGTTLHVKCTAENYPLGSRAGIYFRMEPLHLNYYTNPLIKGCFFVASEVVAYTCSFTTDLSMYKKGTTFKCAPNSKYPKTAAYTKTDDLSVRVVRTLSKARRPGPLLNCTNRMGQPALAWNINAEKNITRYTPGTHLMAWCILACHYHPNKYELVWILDKRARFLQRTLRSRVENLTLEHNLTREDDGKVLECRLVDRSSEYSIITKLTTTLRIEESHLSQVTENYSSENQETTIGSSISHENTVERFHIFWSFRTQTAPEESSTNQENITESSKDQFLISGRLTVQALSTWGLLDDETTMRTLLDQNTTTSSVLNQETTKIALLTLTTQDASTTFSPQTTSSTSFLWAVVVPLLLLLLAAAAVGVVCWRQRVRRRRWNPSLQKASELAGPNRWDSSPEAESVGVGGYSGTERFSKVSFSSIVDYD